MPNKINSAEVKWDETPQINSNEVQWDNQPQPDSIGKQIYQNQKRSWGLFGRNVVEGATALPNLVGDIAGLKSSQGVSDLLTKIGLPQEETTAEKIAGGMTRGIAGTVLPMGAGAGMVGSASPTISSIGQALSASPGTQMLSGATGGGAASTAKEMGRGPTIQTIAGLIGGMAPSGAEYLAGQIPRFTLGGGTKGQQNISRNVPAFTKIGTTPTVGQATEARIPRAIESALAKTPGSAGVIAKKAAEDSAAIGNSINNITEALAPRIGATETGRQIEKGIIGKGGFISQFRDKQKQLYNFIDKFIPATTEVPVTNTQAALNKLAAPIANAEGFSQPLINPFFGELRDGLMNDLKQRQPQMTEQLMTQNAPKTLPYAALKQMRTKVGDMLSSTDIRTDTPRAELKQIYAALSEDMKGAAVLSSNPKAATQAFQRANNYSTAGYTRIDNILQSVVNSGNPEDIFQAAISGTRDGATTLRAVMQSIPQDARNALTATIVKKMGTALPNQQNNIGDIFSTNTFLTNWDKLSSEAKMTIFGRQGPEFKNSMDAIAKVASNIREGSKVFSNPSGTAPSTALLGEAGTVGGGIMLGIMGHPIAGGVAIGGVALTSGTANLSAKLMTNPRFVNWLAKQTRTPIEALPIVINQFVQSAKTSEDKDIANNVKQTFLPSSINTSPNADKIAGQFKTDSTMKNYELGKWTPKGFEVWQGSTLKGYYGEK